LCYSFAAGTALNAFWRHETITTSFLEPDSGGLFMRIEPLGDKLVVKRTEADETTAGGIVLPDSAREKPQQGRVLSVGSGKLLDDGTRGNLQVNEGDRVLFASYAGSEIEIDGAQLLIMSESDILAVIQ
jgi:chaperonin GroES